MSCCSSVSPAEFASAAAAGAAEPTTLRLSAPGLHCGGCVAAVEGALARAPGVLEARANLTRRVITVAYRPDVLDADEVARVVAAAGFEAFPIDDAAGEERERAAARDLLQRMAVAGFASANVMLLSVAVWSGAEGATRDLMHWISALIALPAVAYCGRPFFASALEGLRAWRLNMDAPISLAILLAAGVSLSETLQGGEEAYFDASVTLIFLLLIGRWLDREMRAKARGAAARLARLAPRGAWVFDPEGGIAFREARDLRVGDRIRLAAGERLAVDAVVESGAGGVDLSIVTGESAPAQVGPGDAVSAGALSVDAALELRAVAVGEDTSLEEIRRLVAAAEERKSRLARLADKAAAIYAPVVHAIALATFLGWLYVAGDARAALLAAAAVLIVTCPCALGLAAPMAQAVASGALFRRGVMLKDGGALERLARIDAAAFDKTGVLTEGAPQADPPADADAEARAVAAALASRSRHPLAEAVSRWARAEEIAPAEIDAARETPGAGIEALYRGARARLGSASFCEVDAAAAAAAGRDGAASEVWLRVGDGPARLFRLRDALRVDAAETAQGLAAAGLKTLILSGDRPETVDRVAAQTGIADHRGGLRPEEKIAAIDALQAEGRVVLMVGDGVNDAPALAAADVSMAPASAADVGRAAADLVFVGARLGVVAETWTLARRTRRVILQNFALAAGYNLIAIPVAALGFAGPLVSAIAMSSSSLLVTLNALRLAAGPKTPAVTKPPAATSRPEQTPIGSSLEPSLKTSLARSAS